MRDGAVSSKPSMCSFYQVHLAYETYESALESFRCHLQGQGSFFDARRTWYRLLKNFSIRKEDERLLLPCAFEKDTAKLFDIVPSSNCSATADQLCFLSEARLCNKAQLHVLQDVLWPNVE